MLIEGLSADQVRVASGCSFMEAQTAIYLAALSREHSLSAAGEKTGLSIRELRDLAYRWGITFVDYDPSSFLSHHKWVKVTIGWDLLRDDEVVGECRRRDGRYVAAAGSCYASTSTDPRVAMRNATIALDTWSHGETDFADCPVSAEVIDADGSSEGLLFPPSEAEVNRFRRALQGSCEDRRAA